MRLPGAKDVAKTQQLFKATWEASQGWLWLALMWLSIAVNFSHIEDILSGWAGISDWTTWCAALIVEVISGLAWSNALTNLGTMLASTGRSATKERKRRARVYFALSLVAGLVAVSFSGYANVLWFNLHILAGLVAPAATVICAVMEASRRYEIRVEVRRQQDERQVEDERKKVEAERQVVEDLRQRVEGLGPAKDTLMALQRNPMATQVELAAAIGKSRTAVRNHLGKLVEAGAIQVEANGKVRVLWE